jgi:hypothetical protein
MAMKAVLVLALALTVLVDTGRASAQSVHVESDLTAGYSTDRIAAAATQVRLFGDVGRGLRVYLEAAWAARTDDSRPTDAFGAAYPYNNRAQATEVYVERLFRPGRALVGFRGGRYRTPFGISTRGDYAYSGFLRAPLIRYDGYFALSNNYLEDGAELVVGVPQLYASTTIGRPADVGSAPRRPGTDSVSRVQAYRGDWIVGASHIRTTPYMPAIFAHGPSVFTGVDLRWTHDGVQVSGEWITGRPFDGTSTRGWHAAVVLHRPSMGPVTVVSRAEALDYVAIAPFARQAHRQTVGARIRLPKQLAAQVNVLHQTGDLSASRATALDLALTYSIRLP